MKDIKKRVRDGNIVIELEEALAGPATSAAAPATVAPILLRRSLVVGLAGLVLGGLITGLAVWRLRRIARTPGEAIGFRTICRAAEPCYSQLERVAVGMTPGSKS